MRAIILWVVFALGGVNAVAADQPSHLFVGEAARPPLGWVEFCARNRSDCEPPRVTLTAAKWNELVLLNGLINLAVKPVEDIDHWGVVERWDYPDGGEGDCEDYVLLKRRELIRLGWPREALLVTVVRDRDDKGHAVLTVVTDGGDIVLDNQTNEVMPWHRTGHRFVKRQSQWDPNVWVSLREPATSTLGR